MKLKGKIIVKVRNLTEEELQVEGWDKDKVVSALVLNDGTLIYPSIDTEGNGPGELFGQGKHSARNSAFKPFLIQVHDE